MKPYRSQLIFRTICPKVRGNNNLFLGGLAGTLEISLNLETRKVKWRLWEQRDIVNFLLLLQQFRKLYFSRKIILKLFVLNVFVCWKKEEEKKNIIVIIEAPCKNVSNMLELFYCHTYFLFLKACKIIHE